MLTKSDMNYFKKASKVAEISDYNKINIGCIAVYQGTIIGVGFNTNKTHPIQKKYNRYRNGEDFIPKLHAEINCLNSIRHLDINFTKVKLYIYRKRKTAKYGMCRPCPSCMAAIKDLGIKNIYYTTNDGYVYERINIEGSVA